MTRDRDRGRDKDRDRDRVQHSLEALDCWADYRGGYLLHLLNSSRNQHQKKLTVQRVAVEHSHIAVALDYLCHAQTDNSYNNTYNNSYNSSTDFHGTRTNSRNDPDSESASSSCGSPANRAGAVGCCVVLLDRLPVRGVVPTNEDVVSFCEAIFRNNSNCNSICNSNINSNSNSDQRFGLESAEIDATAIRSSPNRPELTGVKVQYFSSLLTQMQFFKTSETNFDTVDNSSGATANQSEFLYISDASGCIFIYYYSREETSNSWQLMFRYELINNSSLIMSYISSTSHLRNNYYYSVPFSYINIDEQSIVWYVEINETENKHDKEKPLNRITPSNSYKLCISSIKISLSSNSLTIGKPMVIMNSENSSSFGRIERVTISSGGVWCITKTLADSAGNTMRNTITNCTSYQVYFYNYSTCRISELVVPEQFLEHDSSTVLVDTCETGHCVAESHQYYYHPLNKDSKSHLIMHIDAPIRPGAEVDSCDAASYLGYIVCLEQYNDIIKISNNIAVASIVSKTMLADHCSDRISDIKALKSIQDNYFFIALSSKRQVIVTKLATSSSIRSSEKMVKQLYKTFDNYCKAFALPNIYYTYSNNLTRKLICVSENLQGDSIHRSSESNFPDLILMGSSFVCGIRSKSWIDMATTGDSDCAVESIPSPPPHIETTAQLFDRGRPSIEINDSINPTDSDLQSRCLSSRDDNIMFLVKKATSRLDKWTDDFLAKVEQSIGESYDSEGDISWAVYSPPLFFAEEDVDLEIEKLMSAYGKEGEHSKSSDAQKEDDNEKNKNVSAIAPKDVSTYQSALPFRKFEDFFDVSTVFPSKVAYPHCWMDCLDIVTLYCPEENDLLQLLNLKNVSNDYYPRSGGKVYSLSDFIDPFLLAEITQSFHPQNHESDGDYFNDLVAQLVRRMLESSSHALYDVVLQLWTIEGNFNSSNMVDEVDDSNAFTMSGLEQLQHSNRNSLLPSRRYDRQFSLGGLDLHEDAFDDNKKRRSIEHFVSPTVANEVENFSVDEESDEGIMGIGNVAFEDSLIQGSGHLSVKDRVFSAVKMLIVCVELRQDQKDTLLKLLIFCGEYLLVIDRLINWNMDDLLFAYAVRMAASANTLAGLRYQPIDRNSDAKLTDERDPASDGGKQEEKHYKQHSYNQLYHRHGRGAAFVDVDYAADIPVDLTRCTMIEACAEVDVEKYFGESIATRRMEEAIPVFHHTVKHFLQKGSWSFVVEMLLVRPYDYPYYLLLELFARLPSLPAYEAELMRRAYFCY